MSHANSQKLFGVVRAHSDFLAVVGVGCFVMGLRFGGDIMGWAVAIAASAIVHELAQLAVLRALGVRAPLELGLHHTARTRTKDLLPWQAIVVALGGPLANAIVALLFFGHQDLSRFGMASAAFAVVEVSPMLPLDGGVVLRAVLDGTTCGRGERLAQRISLGVAISVIVVGLAIGAIEVMLVGAACAVLAAMAVSKERADAHARREAADLERASAALDAHDLVKARELVASVAASSGTAQSRGEAAELGAWIELRAGDAPAAKAQLVAMPDTLRPSALLRATLRHVLGEENARKELEDAFAQVAAVDRVVPALVAFGRGDEAAALVTARALEPEWLRGAAAHLFRGKSYEASAVVSQRAFEATNVADHAYNAACALAQARRQDEAVAWLVKAVEAGFTDGDLARTDGDLAPLRGHASFAGVLVSLGGTHPYR